MGRGNTALRAVGAALKGGASAWSTLDKSKRANRTLQLRERAADRAAAMDPDRLKPSVVREIEAAGLPVNEETIKRFKWKSGSGSGGGSGDKLPKKYSQIKAAKLRVQTAEDSGETPDPYDVRFLEEQGMEE